MSWLGHTPQASRLQPSAAASDESAPHRLARLAWVSAAFASLVLVWTCVGLAFVAALFYLTPLLNN